jgi:chemotaxis protein CheD
MEQMGAGALPQLFLLPGAMHCSDKTSLVTTVLGSCVAVVLWDRARGVSGINHFLLPNGNGDQSLRYGDVAIDRLVVAMRRLDCRIDGIEAKVFGGAAVLPMNNPENNVGTRNVDVALARLQTLGIPIVARRTGGKSGLSVRLFTATGEVLIRRVASTMVHSAGQVMPFHDSNRA